MFCSMAKCLLRGHGMKKITLFLAVIGTTLSASALTITPSTGVLNVSRWQGDDNSNFNADAIEAAIGVGGQLTEVYKQDIGAVADSGSAASAYVTTFSNSASDPSDALIDFISGTPISGTSIFLYVKDGDQSPAYYIFNISGWNGTDDINLRDFWPEQGAISHVAILTGTATVPDGGATVALLGLGIAALGVGRRFIN